MAPADRSSDLVGQEHVSTHARQRDQRRAASRTRSSSPASAASARRRAPASSPRRSTARKGPTADALPCSVPPARKSRNGTDVDVQEIDGASYNGVDDVRRLQESLALPPRARSLQDLHRGRGPHALADAAWNAFLKTLEEPPPHVKFIFATTEVHKVPVTILSPLPALRLQADPHAARSPSGSRFVLEQEEHRGRRRGHRAHRPRGGGQHARRDEPARSGDRLGGREARRRGGLARARRGRAQRAARSREERSSPATPRRACASSASSPTRATTWRTWRAISWPSCAIWWSPRCAASRAPCSISPMKRRATSRARRIERRRRSGSPAPRLFARVRRRRA